MNNYYAARDKEIEGGANHWSALECYNETNGGQRIIPLSNNVELEILYNYYYDHKTSDENNYSVCVMLNQGDNHYLFTGDLEKEGEGKLVEHYNDLPHCVLYKGGHHGSKTSSSKALLEKITPEYVCICTCAGSDEYSDTNENQFPTQEMIDRIAPYTDKVYVTTYMIDNATHSYASMNGNIVFTVKSGKILLTASNNTLKLKEIGKCQTHGNKPHKILKVKKSIKKLPNHGFTPQIGNFLFYKSFSLSSFVLSFFSAKILLELSTSDFSLD